MELVTTGACTAIGACCGGGVCAAGELGELHQAASTGSGSLSALPSNSETAGDTNCKSARLVSPALPCVTATLAQLILIELGLASEIRKYRLAAWPVFPSLGWGCRFDLNTGTSCAGFSVPHKLTLNLHRKRSVGHSYIANN